jgi:HEPN domain-containing protein
MYKSKDYLQGLFFAHLVLEKLLKANWIKNNAGNHPPRLHNLISLADRAGVKFIEDDLIFLAMMNNFQLEGRYPDYLHNMYKVYKAKQTEPILKQVDKIRVCLLKELR